MIMSRSAPLAEYIATLRAHLPRELLGLPNFVAWDTLPPTKPGGKPRKMPVNPVTGRGADPTDPTTWSSFERALQYYEEHDCSGVGFVFTESEFTGLDFDRCRDPITGVIEPTVQAYIDRFASYTEVSPSGTGVHILVRGTLKNPGRKKGNIEVYNTARYFTLTGNRVAGTPAEIAKRQAELDAFHAEVFGAANPQPEEPIVPDDVDGNASIEPERAADDDWLIERAGRARNGAKFTALMAGDMSGYASPSEAVSALLFHLAFWTRRDPVQMDRLMRRSGLMRDKWDEKRGERTWGENEIAHAIAEVRTVVRVARANATSETVPPVPTTAKVDVLVPGGHPTPQGYVEVNTTSFANNVLNSLPDARVLVRGFIPGEILGQPGDRRFVPLSLERGRLLYDAHARLSAWKAKGRDELVCNFVPCSMDHARLVNAAAIEHENVRELKGIVRVPGFAGREFARLSPGFNKQPGVFYDEHPLLRGLKPIRNKEEIHGVLTDLLIDFPFQAESDWQNFIGLLLTPSVRPAYVGNTPMHLVLSCMERSGKTKLIELVFGQIALGDVLAAMALSQNEEECEKKILSLLLAGTTCIHLDNLPPFLDSRVLASLLTAAAFQGRVLGYTRLARVPNDLITIGSGNNTRGSSEMAKRVVPIRLLPKDDHPEERTDFVHKDLEGYLSGIRPQVVAALLGMVENWRAEGSPAGSLPFGGFEDFARVVGGVLKVQGYTQWLANRKEWVTDADIVGGDLAALVAAWKVAFQRPVKPGEVFDLARKHELFSDYTSGSDVHAGKSGFCRRVLMAATQRPVGNVRIVCSGEGSSRRYRLVELDGGAA